MNERIRLERSGSFVELHQEHDRITHAYGRIGAPPRIRVESCASEAEATDAFARQVVRLEHEHKGYKRCDGRHAELESAIVADPANPVPRLVYADWLLDKGAPRGELISRMAAGREYAGLLAACPYQLAPRWLARWRPEWHLGYVRSVTYEEPHTWVVERSLFEKLFRHPSLMVLEELHLRVSPRANARSVSNALSLRPSTLRRIDARGVESLAPLVEEIPGLIV